MFLLIAFLSALVGALPLFLRGKVGAAIWAACGYGVVNTVLFYVSCPSLAYPIFGGVGFMTLIWLFVSAGIDGSGDYGFELTTSAWAPIVLLAAFILVLAGSCSMFRSDDYYRLIGDVEKREWTKDVQPKDPRHVRLVPEKLAYYLATKQLGEAGGAIGSQFSVSENSLTLQEFHGELWYVAPLEFKGFSVWTSADVTPGFVMVHGEDPNRPAIVKTGHQFRFMESAYFGDNAERHLWKDGYWNKVLSDWTFEINEEGKPFWVVTVSKPTIGWGGSKVLGVVVMDPTSGEHTFYAVGSVPKWIDRVYPSHIVSNYISNWGRFASGWWNSFWGKKDIMKPEEPNIIYGADGDPYWVTGLTSTNIKDNSMVGLMYTNSRTGKSVRYHAVGGTDEAVIELVNNKVAYQKLSGAAPVLYNIYGEMTSIVPLLGESHTFQGVAFVDVRNMRLVVGKDQEDAARQYQELLATSGQQLAPEKSRDSVEKEFQIDRISAASENGTTVYYLYVAKERHIFTGTRKVSSELVVTQPGDHVRVRYVNSGEGVMPILSLKNLDILIEQTDVQRQLAERVESRKDEVSLSEEGRSARGRLEEMTDEEIGRLLQKRDNEKK